MGEKTAHFYRRLPYTRRVEPVYYRAWIEELPSIEVFGDSQEEILARLGDIFVDRIETMIEAGDDIPEPDLWPTGLFGCGASENLRRLIRETEFGPHEMSLEEVAVPELSHAEMDHLELGLFETSSLEAGLLELSHAEVSHATAQVAAGTNEELAGQFEPWTPTEIIWGLQDLAHRHEPDRDSDGYTVAELRELLNDAFEDRADQDTPGDALDHLTAAPSVMTATLP